MEEIYINNIKVIGPTATNYLVQWPGSEDKKLGWPDWYKSYHTGGWHTGGNSANNKFLCMGNMWDRIIQEEQSADWRSVDWGSAGLGIPDVETGSGSLDMKAFMDGVAVPHPDKATYYTDNTHNIGIKKDKAAAYHFYAQSASASSSSKEVLSGLLPHIIVKMKCYETKYTYQEGKSSVGKEFVTIKVFSNTNGSTDYITNFRRGYIYRLNLENLLPFFVGKAPIPTTTTGAEDDVIVTPSDPVDPEPEMPNINLTVGVEITKWIGQNVYPVI